MRLPPGFVLDSQPQQVSLPPGFVLDGAEPEPSIAEQAKGRIAANEAAMPGLETSFSQEFGQTPLGGLLYGAAKGVGNTVYNLGKLAHKLPGMDVIAPDTAGAFSGPNEITEALTPEGTWQGAGYMGEQVAEMFVPGAAQAGKLGFASKLLQRAGTLGKMGLEGANAAAVTAAQGGDAGLAGVVGAVAPGVTKVASAAAPMVANTVLGTASKFFKTGANAGKGIAGEGIVAATARGLVEKISAAEDRVGQQIAARLSKSPSAQQPIDVTDAVLSPVMDAITAFRAKGDAAGVQRIKALFDGVDDALRNAGGSIATVTPAQAHSVRKLLDKALKPGGGHGATSTVDAVADDVATTIRRNLSAAITKAVPEIAPLNRQYANLAAARAAAWNKVNNSNAVPRALQFLGRSGAAAALGYQVGGSEGAKVGTLAGMAGGSVLGGTMMTAGLAAAGGPTATKVAPKLFASMVSQSTRDLADEANEATGGDKTLSQQYMLQKRPVYVDEAGNMLDVPAGIVTATLNGDPTSENSPLARWAEGMAKQGKIRPGGQLIFVDR